MKNLKINSFKGHSKKKIWYFENAFILLSQKDRIIQITNLYELYAKISNIRGDIVECGVFKGSSLTKLLTFSHYLDNVPKRKVYGFDVFGKFPNANAKKDKEFIKSWNVNAGDGIQKKELEYLLKKKFKNFKLVKGNVINELPKYNNIIKKIALLHLDMDTYEGTNFCLNFFKNKIVKNGIIILDDYKVTYGATKAVNEFIKKNPRLKINKVKFYKKPSYIKF